LLALVCTAARYPNTLFEGRSKYTPIYVIEEPDGARSLLFERDGAIQSRIKPGEPLDLRLAYARSAMIALGLVPSPKRVLIIGLGGGCMPMFLRTLYPEAEIDVVDIDPEVVSVAKRFFGFKEDTRLRAHVADGRKFVEESKLHYDLIFLDAYGDSSIPRHLATLEFLALAKSRLTERGLVVGNVWAARANPLYHSMRRTYQTAFGQLCVHEVPDSANRIFLSSPRDTPLDPASGTARLGELVKANKIPFDLPALAGRGCLGDGRDDAPLLKDSDNPPD